MRDAGIIGFVPRGQYSDTETYDFLQFVYYEGSTYVAKKETTGNPPAENNEFWQILARGQVGQFLPITGGTIASTTQQMLNLRYSGETGDAIISMFPNNFTNKCVTVQSAFSTLTNSVKFKIFQIMDGVTRQLFEVSDKSKDIFDPKTNKLKPIIVNGDDVGNCIVNGKKLSEWLK